MTPTRHIARATAVAGAALLALGTTAPVAPAEDRVDITNTETVQAYLAPDGSVREARIYEQLSMEGHGPVHLANPVATDGLRNLDEFGSFDAVGGKLRVDENVDGQLRKRAVSNFDAKKIPLKVKVTYLLDGKPVTAKQVVGRSGQLDVRYVVENVTSVDRTFSLDDGTGNMVNRTEKVVIPMVGQLQTTLPKEFSEVRSGEAAVAGDGRGGTKLSFTMTLFGPIGTPRAEFGYSARIRDGQIPAATISGLPVNPLQSPSFKAGAASYNAGAKSGRDLSSGAAQIDENLIKLRDGGNQLLAGLVKLREGSSELHKGLADEAAPGARKLADGTGQLKDGTGQLVDGTGKLVDGTSKLKDGTGQLKDGTGQLKDGTGQLKDGAGQLDVGAAQLKDGLGQARAGAPELIAGLQKVADGLKDLDEGLTTMHQQIGGLPEKARPLHEGIQKLRAGIGTTDQPGTLLNGVDQLRTQIGQGADGLLTLEDKVYKDAQNKADAGAYQKLDCAVRVIKQLNNGGQGTNRDGSPRTSFDPFCYGDKASTLNSDLVKAIASMPESNIAKKQILDALATELEKGRDQLANPNSLGNADDPSYIDGPKPDPSNATMQQALSYIGGRLKNRAVPGLTKVECGLSAYSFGKDTSSPCYDRSAKQFQPGLLEGLTLVDQGVDTLVNGVVDAVHKGVGSQAEHDDAYNRSKAKQPVDPGSLRGGTGALSGGMELIQAGGAQLQDGVVKLDEGAGKLKDGTSRLSQGAGDLDKGASKLAKGAGELDSGAGELNKGAGQLQDGAGRLDEGAGQLDDGAKRLAPGLAKAADGAGQVADGNRQAADGAAKIPDGAQQLHEKGSSKLMEAGRSTAVDYGLKYAAVEAGAQRADREAMPVGAPEGATGLTAYSLEIAGADASESRSMGHGLAGLGLFAAAAATAVVRRRFV
ncbi:hypothetical protein GCM10027418_29860 [Mariniluteicoccus endophyticus]